MQNIKTYWDIMDAVTEMGEGPREAVRMFQYYRSLHDLNNWPASMVVDRTAHAIQSYIAVYYPTTEQECWNAVAFYEIEWDRLQTGN